ncbi:hypothetical protein NLG97_g6290 [Lecanicillium saksenae]|uniref:Uncharacterized protein n=1 Tax=Lecanicillium saksenae TaxID=468837 RepID=A0ACC1QQ18_9HYPO|nr:hypothetical protein NLG97_g6290 [Lecanicillium saksenae]
MDSVRGLPEFLPAETKRQRQWAHKTRTGCVTCRTRRVKCDETKPTCRQCIKSRVQCHGLLYAGPYLNRPAIPEEIEPPSWDLLQSIQYFSVNIGPFLHVDGAEIIRNRLRSTYDRICFVTLVITDRIERASKARGRQLQLWRDAAFVGLWNTFTRYMVKHVSHVNNLLKNDDKNEPEIFNTINLLITLDMIMQNASWQAHMNGYLTYIEYLGGRKSLLTLSDPPPPYITTRLSDELIEAAIACGRGDNILGCPPRTLMAIFHISKLRLQDLSTLSANQHGLFAKIQYIGEGVDSVDVEAWAREQCGNTPEAETLAMMARIMAVAVQLYGILVLPKSCVAAWLAPPSQRMASFRGQSGFDVYDDIRMRYCDRLLHLLRDVGDKPFEPKVAVFNWSMGWPLLVAGVAAATYSKETHEFITDALITLSRGPVAPSCILTVVEKLRSFWRLGQTEWEECFSEPLIVYL